MLTGGPDPDCRGLGIVFCSEEGAYGVPFYCGYSVVWVLGCIRGGWWTGGLCKLEVGAGCCGRCIYLFFPYVAKVGVF